MHPRVLSPPQPPTSSLARIESELGLRGYQRDAIRSFVDRGGRGIAHMATGTGKTLIGIAAQKWAHAGDQKTLIVVPTQALQHQWATALNDHGNLDPQHIATPQGSRQLRRIPQERVIITPIQTAMRNAQALERMVHEQRRTLIIVDECHRAGAPKFSNTLVDAIPYRLGLSATPTRPFDPTGTRRVIDYFEGIAHRYGLGEAVDDGHLAEYTYHVHSVHLTPREQQAYDEINGFLNLTLAEINATYPDAPDLSELGKLLALLRHENEEDLARQLQEHLFARARIVKNAQGKLDVFESLTPHLRDKKTLVFTEEIAFANRIARITKRDNLETHLYHSKMQDGARDKALLAFRNAQGGVLVAVRALDEGLDVPDADVAVLAASSTSPRQHIQRRGRVLRPLKDALKTATLHDFYVIGVDDPYRVARIQEDADRVRTHGFQGPSQDPWRHIGSLTQDP